MRGGSKDKGTALIAALLLVALMAALSVQLIDLTRFTLFRTAQIDARTQALWYARGTRELAEEVLAQSGPPSRTVMRPNELWLSGAQVFPIDGGVVEASVSDGNNCININALSGAASADTDGVGGAAARQLFVAQMITSLAEELAVPAGTAERLKNQMIDWIDPDTRPEPGGAEDAVYGNLESPFRTANQRFYELEEILALPDMTPELYAIFSPWLCVRPTTDQPALNLNTLRIDQSVLLTALFHGRLAASDAEAILFRRPVQGYDAVEEFWSDPVIARIDDDPSLHTRTDLRTGWFEMQMRVRLHEAEFEFSQLAEFSQGGAITRHATRFGAF